MMGREVDYQQKLFVTGFSLEKRVRNDHFLRMIREKIDFKVRFFPKWAELKQLPSTIISLDHKGG